MGIAAGGSLSGLVAAAPLDFEVEVLSSSVISHHAATPLAGLAFLRVGSVERQASFHEPSLAMEWVYASPGRIQLVSYSTRISHPSAVTR